MQAISGGAIGYLSLLLGGIMLLLGYYFIGMLRIARRSSRIRVVAKESVEYREGSEAYVFGAGWGVTPAVLSVPAVPDWRRVMPVAFRDRRDEIVDRLRSYSGHVVVDDMTEL